MQTPQNPKVMVQQNLSHCMNLAFLANFCLIVNPDILRTFGFCGVCMSSLQRSYRVSPRSEVDRTYLGATTNMFLDNFFCAIGLEFFESCLDHIITLLWIHLEIYAKTRILSNFICSRLAITTFGWRSDS